MNVSRTFAAPVLSCSLLLSCSDADSGSPREERALLTETNVVYAHGLTERGSVPLQMDIYRTDEACETLKPLVLIIHGGAFVRGSKESNGWDQRARDAARRGYVAAAIDYRLIPDAPVIAEEFEPVWADLFEAKAHLPSNTHSLETYARGVTAAIEDTVSALRFLESDSPHDRCIDVSRIGVWGGSAGAIAAVHVAHGLDGSHCRIAIRMRVRRAERHFAGRCHRNHCDACQQGCPECFYVIHSFLPENGSQSR